MSTSSRPGAPISNEKVDPNSVEGSNEYAGDVAPDRGDQGTTAGQAGNYYPGAEPGLPGNVVEKDRIVKTVDQASPDLSVTSPAGSQSASGRY